MLFGGGAFGIWELDPCMDLRRVRCTLATQQLWVLDLMLAD